MKPYLITSLTLIISLAKPQLKQTFTGKTHATLPGEAGKLTADPYLSLHSSKSNTPV